MEIKANNKYILLIKFSYYWVADRQGRQVGFLASQRVDGKLILPEAVKTLTIKKA